MTAAVYATPQQLAAYATIQTVPTEAGLVQAVLRSASRQVDLLCNRTFGRGGEAVAVLSDTVVPIIGERPKGYFFARSSTRQCEVWLPDCAEAPTSVETASGPLGTWTELPESEWRVVQPEDGWPVVLLHAHIPASSWVRVTATPGWPAVPSGVAQATMLTAASDLLRRSSPGGQFVVDQTTGEMVPTDPGPGVRKMLAPYRRRVSV